MFHPCRQTDGTTLASSRSFTSRATVSRILNHRIRRTCGTARGCSMRARKSRGFDNIFPTSTCVKMHQTFFTFVASLACFCSALVVRESLSPCDAIIQMTNPSAIRRYGFTSRHEHTHTQRRNYPHDPVCDPVARDRSSLYED